MTRTGFLFLVLITMGMVLSASEVESALIFGAQVKVVFSIQDDKGNPIENALVRARFYLNREPGKNPFAKGTTSKEGIYVAKGMSAGDFNYLVERKGYYPSRGTFPLYKRERKDDCVKGGRWQPYGVTNLVVLKSMKNPIPLYANAFDGRITNSLDSVGFDIQQGDFVFPHGKGRDTDIVLSYKEEKGAKAWEGKYTLTIDFPNRDDGAYIDSKDMYSELVSSYIANTNAIYERKLTFIYDSLNYPKPRNETLLESQYIVFRLRTQRNQKGEIVSAHYAKLYGPLTFFHKRLSFLVYFNPNPNDPNLEFLPGQNLSNSNFLSSKIYTP